MTLRCKVGDLAIKLTNRHAGRFCTVLAPYSGPINGGGWCYNGWLVEYQHCLDSPPKPGGYCSEDSDLLPIRPDLNEPSLELELRLDRLIVQGKELTCVY